MIADRQTARRHHMLGPVLLAVGVCLLGGCSSMPGSFGLSQTALSSTGPKEGTEAFKKQVHKDRFPTAAQALAESSLTVVGG